MDLVGATFVSFANGVPTQEERRQIEQSLTEKFTGAVKSVESLF